MRLRRRDHGHPPGVDGQLLAATGIKRIGLVASRMVPVMVSLYMLAGITILVKHYAEIPEMFMFILKDALTGDAVLGGALGAVIITGIRQLAHLLHNLIQGG